MARRWHSGSPGERDLYATRQISTDARHRRGPAERLARIQPGEDAHDCRGAFRRRARRARHHRIVQLPGAARVGLG